MASQNGAFLVAFLALFVRYAGGHVWDLCRFLAFQLRSHSTTSDMFHQQQQVVLRNSPAELDTIWNLATVMWAWKSDIKSPFRRSILLITWAVLHVAAFNVAAIFSSYVTASSSDVLLKTARCGTYSSRLDFLSPTFNPWKNSESITEYVSNIADAHSNFGSASSYVVACYNNSATMRPCLPLGREKLTWSKNSEASCPFDERMCRHGAVEFDTGYIDSNLDFGINAPMSDRVQFRVKHTCAPLLLEGFTSRWLNATEAGIPLDPVNYPDNEGDQVFKQYYYGPSINYGMDATFQLSNYSLLRVFNSAPSTNYILSVSLASDPALQTPNGDFTAIPELMRTDAVVILLFLATKVAYLAPLEDPWFNSTTPITDPTGTQYYVSGEEPVHVLGCAETFEYCNNANGAPNCIHLNSKAGFDQGLEDLKLSSRQSSTLARIKTSLDVSSIYSIVTALGGSVLLANTNAIGGASTALPVNQWILELEHLFATMLNSAQMMSTQYILGPNSASDDKYIVPLPVDDQWMCDSQIIKSSDYSSFSLLGLIIIFVIGGSFIILNLSLATILARFSNHVHPWTEAWNQSSMLQLHRRALDPQGVANWETAGRSVPIIVRPEDESCLISDSSRSVPSSLSAHKEGKPDVHVAGESSLQLDEFHHMIPGTEPGEENAIRRR